MGFGKQEEIYIVPGGAGLVGRHIVAELQAKHPKATIIISSRNGIDKDFTEIFAESAKLPEVIEASQLPSFIAKNQGKIKGIIDAGAIKPSKDVDAETYDLWNHQKPAVIFNAAAKHNIPYVLLSSIQTDYEKRGIEPSHYARSKKNLEDHVLGSENKPQHMCVLRCSNIYGSNELEVAEGHDKHLSIVTQFTLDTYQRNPVKMYAETRDTGEEVSAERDFVHARDVAKISLWAIEEKRPRESYDVGTGQVTNTRELLNIIAECQGAPNPAPNIEPFPESFVQSYLPNTSQLLEDLKKSGDDCTFIRLEEGVSRILTALENSPTLE